MIHLTVMHLSKCPAYFQVLEHFMRNGKTKEEEQEEKQQVTDLSEEESLSLMRSQLGEEHRAQVEAMLAQGVSLKDIMDHFMTKPPAPPQSEEVPVSGSSAASQAGELRQLLQRSDLSDDQKLELLQGGMTEEQRRKVEELIKSGLSVEQVNLGAVSGSTVLTRFLTISPGKRRQPSAGKSCWLIPTCHSNKNWIFSVGT